MTKELKSPSVAAAEICANARTCEVRFVAWGRVSEASWGRRTNHGVDVGRDLLPSPLDVVHLGRDAEVSLGPDLVRDSRDLGSERRELKLDQRWSDW